MTALPMALPILIERKSQLGPQPLFVPSVYSQTGPNGAKRGQTGPNGAKRGQIFLKSWQCSWSGLLNGKWVTYVTISPKWGSFLLKGHLFDRKHGRDALYQFWGSMIWEIGILSDLESLELQYCTHFSIGCSISACILNFRCLKSCFATFAWTNFSITSFFME